MIDYNKLISAKKWIEKLANGINPLNDEPVKDDDLVNNVHISRCLFYVADLLGDIRGERAVKRQGKNVFALSAKDVANIPVSTPNGIANFVKLVNGVVPPDMKSLTASQLIKWLRDEGLLQEVLKENGRKTNLPTEKGCKLGITTEVLRNPDGLEFQRVLYSVEAQRFMLSNIESIASSIVNNDEKEHS